MLADLAEIDLGCFEILMSQDNLGHDFQRYSVSAGTGCRVSPEVMRGNGDTKFGPELLYKSPGGGITDGEYPCIRG